MWDIKHAELVCTECGTTSDSFHLAYDPPRHVNGTLERQIGPQKYQRSNHLRKWIGKIDRGLLHSQGRNASELEKRALEYVILFERNPKIRGACKNINYAFLLRRIMIDMGVKDEDISLKRIKNRSRLKTCMALWERLSAAARDSHHDEGFLTVSSYIKLGKRGVSPPCPKKWYKDLERRVPWVKKTRLAFAHSI